MSACHNTQMLSHQVMMWCDELAQISQSKEYIDRRFLTHEHRLANQIVANWMEQSGMHTWQDEAANLWGRLSCEDENAPRLIMGSHLDTVPNGGKYDGMLGVLTPIALVRALNSSGIKLPFHLDIVGFGDEEGTRFGSTLLGSRALTGRWQKDWDQLTDHDGVSLRQAMTDFGLDFDKVGQAKINLDNLLGYVETHIEQGPILEANDLPVGVVTAIAGARRFQIDVIGSAGHAGTVPMALRQDSLVASAEMILAIESIAQRAGVVATAGFIENYPNSVNVIAGTTRFSLDIRSKNNEARDAALDKIMNRCQSIAYERGLELTSTETHCAPAVSCDERLQRRLANAMESEGLDKFSLFSGAGHDAMAMAEICPVAMLFTRCHKGISHHPAEAIKVEDVASAINVLFSFVTEMNPY